MHVLVPEHAHVQARKAALDSRMPFKVYMGHLMSAAQPISIEPSVSGPGQGSTQTAGPNSETSSTVLDISAPITEAAASVAAPVPDEPETIDPASASDSEFAIFM